MSGTITIFSAEKIITMNPSRPTATHVAVRNGRILGVGSLEELSAWGEYRLDERLVDKILMPGLVEAHSHIMAGGLWKYPYVGFYDRHAPDGTLHPGCHSFEAVVERLRAACDRLEDPDTPLLAWGFDPIYFGSERMTVEHLDQVDTRRPVVVLHVSAHLANVNTAALDLAGIDACCEAEGVVKDATGKPTGELREPAAMFPVFEVTGADFFHTAVDPDAVWNLARVARNAGVTTVTDLFHEGSAAANANYAAQCADPGLPMRLVVAIGGLGIDPQQALERVQEGLAISHDKLLFGPVKLFTDGSIQGFSARLQEPGYFNGAENGIWMIPPTQLHELVYEYHRAGVQLHIHANGDEASRVTLDAIEAAQRLHPWPDHRHTLQHCQVAPSDQFRRMAALGVCANLFANHVFYWGDQHRTQTLGPERAARMDACATALRHGVPLAMHSDAPITPIGPLFTAWCAVNRLTASNQVLGEYERISVADALHAITLGAAYTLKLDHLIGSIESGKFADFAVLEADPTCCEPAHLKDIPVWGTVLGGQLFPADGHGGA